MKVHQLTLHNFRGFADATLDLDRPVTVLFGANGSGKSSVLEALVAAFSEVFAEEFDGQRGHSLKLTDEDISEGAKETSLSIDVSNGDVRRRVSFGRVRGVAAQRLGRNALLMRLFGAAPFLPIYYESTRAVATAQEAFATPELPTVGVPLVPLAIYDALAVGHLKFRSLFQWFKEREDVENELKVASGDLSLEDPQLAAIRRAVAGMLPGFAGLRVQRDPLHIVITKRGSRLALDQLSDGEKLTIALAADLARRLAIAYVGHGDPIQGDAVVLIDEIELHLHPAWQRTVLGRLRATFPNCQFVVTTHSPQVLSEVPNDAVTFVSGFQFARPPAPTAGRDTNAILTEAMGTIERPEREREMLRAISSLIDAGRYVEAQTELDTLVRALTEHDREVVGLRTMLHFLGDGDVADPQGA